ncbi:zinc finger SWIM domain-containing protein 8 homolog [Culicoides brevitarsis]|uniref:zinc finger SWIM domain-containing protein 8 homolog n=1 Tax=Culicoides brevitarsis TaxID=469753 RepID=UPI00307C8EB1
MVFSDVNYLTNSAPPAAAEWSSLLRPLRGREPEGMWNLLSIVREMYRRCDRNAIRLLEIITEECMACDQILVWWFNIKLALLVGSGAHGGGKHSSTHSNTNATQHACASLCDEIVVLWRLAALNPELAPDERDMLHAQFTSWHLKILDRVTKCFVQSSSHSSKQQQNLRNDAELFTGFKPAIEACYLDWEDYPIAGITHTVDTNPMYHCPFTCFKHTDSKTEINSKINSSQAVLTNNTHHYSSTSNPAVTHHHSHAVRQKREKAYRDRQQMASSSNSSAESKGHASTSSHGAAAALKDRAPGNRSSVSSEGFCENEDDSIISQNNSVVTAVTLEIVSSSNSSNNINSKDTVNNVNSSSNNNNSSILNSQLSTSSSATSNDMCLPANYSVGFDDVQASSSSNVFESSAVANEEKAKDSKAETSVNALVTNTQALDSSISSSSSSSSSQSNDSNSLQAAFERDQQQPSTSGEPQNIAEVKSVESPKKQGDEAGAEALAAQNRRPSKDESFSSSESHQDDFSVYYYDANKAANAEEEEKLKNIEAKQQEATPSKFPVFSNIRPTEDAWDILFARAEGLHAHGHDREACTLGIRLAEELLANPPNLMVDVAPPVKRKGKKHNVNPIFHQISVLASATLAKCAFLCTVLSENSDHYHLAFRVCLFGLEMARPPASTKPLEVKLNNQESDLLAHLKKINLGPEELKKIREKAEQLRDGTFKSRGNALLPIMLASFIFDALVTSNNVSKEPKPKVLSAYRLPTDEQLGFEAAVAALGLKANVAESEHPLLCEGTRRQRGDLALTLLYHYKDEPRNICRIMEKLLDRDIHTLIKTPLLPSYYSNNPPIRSQSSQMRGLEDHEGARIHINESVQNDLSVNSRPQSSTSAELENNISALSLNCYPAKPTTNQVSMVNPGPSITNRSKESRYKGKRSYPSIPNQPSEAGAHFIFELAKNVLTKAGGTSSTSLFTQVSTNNNHHGPHRALHMCAFQLGLYALGLHNCVSSNWLSRTYSSHVSWIMGQAMEIGAPAISFMIDTWEGHLTPPEAAAMADRASSRGWDSNMVLPAAELALSVLPHAAALNPNEIQRAILQCKEQSDLMLERACLTVENAAKSGGVYPEVLFQVARYWYELYLRNTPGGELEPEEQNDYFNVNLMPLIESGDIQHNAQAPNTNAPIPPVVVAANPTTGFPPQGINPVSRIVQPYVPFNYHLQGIYQNIPFHANQMPMYMPQFQYPPVPNQNFPQMQQQQQQQMRQNGHPHPAQFNQYNNMNPGNVPGANQAMGARTRHPHQFSPTQLKYLLAAYNVGMLALETLARRVHDDRPQAKYARNPPYGDDIKWLLRISKRLGTQYLHQFCVCVVNSIVSPFVLHEVAIESAHYLARNNPTLVLQHLRSALSPLVQKCQQMYIQSIHQKLYHLTVADYEVFTSTILSARNAFQITPDGPQQFKDWLQSIRRSKSCKKELWTQINNALQNNSK